QTATTVGYGDVTPKSLIGRLVAAAVMLEGIAFVAIVTAVITSTFVERAMKERRGAGTASWDALEARLAELAERFEQVEESMRRHVGETPPERFTPIERGPGRDQPVR